MSRIRSPNYPQLSLDEALKRVKQVFDRERQHPTSRDVVLLGMGYNGANGASLGSLSAAIKYGLLEKAGDDLRVSDRAVAILHPHSPEERAAAIHAAATAPALFAELLDHFKGGLPSDDSLRAYLVRRGFAQSALTSVIQAFRDTISLVKDTGEVSDMNPALQPTVEREIASPSRQFASRGGSHVAAGTAPVVASRALEVTLKHGRISVAGDLGTRDEVESLIRMLTMNKEFLPAKEE